jgi:hypothetical protein
VGSILCELPAGSLTAAITLWQPEEADMMQFMTFILGACTFYPRNSEDEIVQRGWGLGRLVL